MNKNDTRAMTNIERRG